VLGLRQQQQRPTSLAAALAMLLALAAPFTLGQLVSESPASAAPAGPAALAGTPFSPEALAAARAARTPTFLYFTADWCLTCKVNEKGALSDPAVAESFRKAGIKVMVGDWTRPDPAIARFLEQQGRAGIPLYLFYSADGTVIELPQLLSADMLTTLASPRSAAPA
jgi:thiol:disulfide interchange protein